MLLNKKDFSKLAVSMGIAKQKEVKMFFEEFPKDSYDDYEDIVELSRKVEVYRRWAQSKLSTAYGSTTYKKALATGGGGYLNL